MHSLKTKEKLVCQVKIFIQVFLQIIEPVAFRSEMNIFDNNSYLLRLILFLPLQVFCKVGHALFEGICNDMYLRCCLQVEWFLVSNLHCFIKENYLGLFHGIHICYLKMLRRLFF